MDPTNLDDATLISLICQKHPEAFSELYDRYYRLVYGLALNMIKDQATAEEITLDVFTRVWEKANTYQLKQAKVSTWLTAITRNHTVDIIRRQQSRPEHNSVSWAEVAPQTLPNTDNLEDLVELAIQQKRVRAAVAQLPQQQKEALALAFFKGYTHYQVSELLNEPLGTVKTRIRTAMKTLRHLLNDDQKSTK